MSEATIVEGASWSAEEAAAALQRFGADAEGSSPLYHALATAAAHDAQLVDIARDVRRDQVVGFSFFGGVQYHLLEQPGAELARYYPGFAESPLPVGEAFPAFRAFCLENEASLRALLRVRRVQTNEVARTSFVLPALGHVARLEGDRPLAIIDVGASAGLNLHQDRYFYDYGVTQWGDPYSDVRIVCRYEGDQPLPLAPGRPAIAYRAGIDILPVDLAQEDEARWLRATVWPEHRSRASNLTAAIRIARSNPAPLYDGDASVLLPKVADAVPDGLPIVVYQTYALNQFPPDARERFMRHLDEIARRRTTYFVSTEGGGSAPRRSRIEFSRWQDGRRVVEHAADGEIHGSVLRWLLKG